MLPPTAHHTAQASSDPNKLASASSSESVFTSLMNPKFIQKDLSLLPDLSDTPSIIADHFVLYTTKDRRVGIRVFCQLKKGFVIISDEPGKRPIGFMDVNYSRMKLTLERDEKKLRLVKNKKYEELWSEDEELLKRWFNMLAPFCVYSNFRSDFDIVGLLGQGNFAKVYLVENKATGKRHSVKIFDKEVVKNDPFELKCFL